MLGAPRLRRTRDATRENGLHETFVRIKSGYYSHSAGMADGIMHASLPALCACRKSSLAALTAKSAGSREQDEPEYLEARIFRQRAPALIYRANVYTLKFPFYSP